VISVPHKCKNRLSAAFALGRHFVLVEVVRPSQLLGQLDHELGSQSTNRITIRTAIQILNLLLYMTLFETSNTKEGILLE
jgi:hypothetical protein